MKNLQIGIIGSCSDLQYSREAVDFVQELGKAIAESDDTLVFGAEKDCDSLPTIAAFAAKSAGGNTLAITYEKGLSLFSDDAATVVVATGLVRGGGRETALALSCDVLIAIAGGSGTLNEICVAYQAGIPVVVVPNFGGWSQRLAGSYLDDRKRYKFMPAKDPRQALDLAYSSVSIESSI